MTTEGKNEESKQKNLVKATDLPRHGNPNPPKDFVIQDSPPTQLESTIGLVRTSISPILNPISSGFSRAGDIVQTGIAHSSSAIQGLSQSQKSIFNGAVIAFAGFVGYRFSRRRMKLLTGAALAIGTAWYLEPEEAAQKSRMLMTIAENKLPDFTRRQYERFVTPKDNSQTHQQAPTSPKSVN